MLERKRERERDREEGAFRPSPADLGAPRNWRDTLLQLLCLASCRFISVLSPVRGRWEHHKISAGLLLDASATQTLTSVHKPHRAHRVVSCCSVGCTASADSTIEVRQSFRVWRRDSESAADGEEEGRKEGGRTEIA